MPFVLDGQTLPPGQPFTTGDVQYPANVLDLWTAEELAEIGVVWVEPEPQPFDRLGPAKSALAASDITVLRCFEQGQTVPPEWVAYREILRAIVSGGDNPQPTRPDWP
ncbi:hypothetical protein [Brevundimonas sp. NIBR11]|uniref:hypothetical protein n=1 Tax=Brevundimonas sp. NIBR11 TaxID=3015999 RepID=UPI0022F0BE81|nr:hypothetical protein [Brevundimonas sp. NIBR11]WGM31511.1 hypothetical protein KKHFBJBL_01758 [Brevundimonas sp. NIBR11]